MPLLTCRVGVGLDDLRRSLPSGPFYDSMQGIADSQAIAGDVTRGNIEHREII